MRRAACTLLLLAAACSHDLPRNGPPPSRLAASTGLQGGAPTLVDPGPPRAGGTSARSVFAYREHASAPSHASAAPATPHAAEPATAPPTTSQPRDTGADARATLDFPYRYIGRFGPEHEQLAVFVAGGEVTLAKAGDVIAGKFVVRHIGIETVEVALLNAPEVSRTLDIGK